MKRLVVIGLSAWFELVGCQFSSPEQVLSGAARPDSIWRISTGPSSNAPEATLRLWVSLPQHRYVGQGDFEQLFVITELDGNRRISRAYAWQDSNKPLEFRIAVEAGTTRVARIRQIVSEDYLFALSAKELQRLAPITLHPGTQAEAEVQLERNQPL